MKKHIKTFSGISLALLFSATPLACIGEGSSEQGPDLAAAGDTEAAPLEGDGHWSGKSQVEAPAVIDNSAPCGDQTIAVVNAPSGATYVFCGLGDGTTGVLEELPGGDLRGSLLDTFSTPADLLRAVAPGGAAVPDHLIASVEAGSVAEERQPMYPIKLGTPAPMSLTSSDHCSSESQFLADYGWSASFIPFMEEFVEDVGECSLHIWYTEEAKTWTSHQRTASNYQVYEEYGGPPWAGACAAKEHVASCGGSTLFEALRQEAPGNAWTTALSYWVSANSVATWKMYASDCNGNNDRDDMRYKGNSEPGAYHRYMTIFIKWFGNGFCDFK